MTARGPRHRTARLQHVQRGARRPGRQRRGPRASRSARRCSRRASAWPTASTTTRSSARGFGAHVQPDAVVAPDARPRIRLTIAYSGCRRQRLRPVRQPGGRHPGRAQPGHREPATSCCRAAWRCGRPIPTTSSAARSTRGTCSSSVACRSTSSISAGYVGTATRGGYADINLNYAESRRQRRAPVLHAGRQRQHPRLAARSRSPTTTRCRWR